jgi:alpha-galactosidase/6-phospho-beta-glucosidase family protein
MAGPYTPQEDLKPCGTTAAYRRHINRGEPTCDPCKEANRIFFADYRESRKTELNTYHQQWYTNQTEAQKFKKRIKRYGLTLEEFAWMFHDQDFRCAICFTTESDGKDWHIDHDHECCAGERSCGR